jgi:hypothetical protein
MPAHIGTPRTRRHVACGFSLLAGEGRMIAGYLSRYLDIYGPWTVIYI